MSDFYNKYPYTDFHELNLDWIIGRIKKLTEDWKATDADWHELHDYVENYFNNLDIQNEVDNKIDDMIADGDMQTLINNILGFVTVKMYGAKGDGVTNDTVAIQTAINDAQAVHGTVVFPDGVYIVDDLYITDFIGLIGERATLKASASCINVLNVAVPWLGNERQYHGDNAFIQINIDCNHTASAGIYASQINAYTVKNSTIRDFTQYGIYSNNVAAEFIVHDTYIRASYLNGLNSVGIYAGEDSKYYNIFMKDCNTGIKATRGGVVISNFNAWLQYNIDNSRYLDLDGCIGTVICSNLAIDTYYTGIYKNTGSSVIVTNLWNITASQFYNINLYPNPIMFYADSDDAFRYSSIMNININGMSALKTYFSNRTMIYGTFDNWHYNNMIMCELNRDALSFPNFDTIHDNNSYIEFDYVAKKGHIHIQLNAVITSGSTFTLPHISGTKEMFFPICLSTIGMYGEPNVPCMIYINGKGIAQLKFDTEGNTIPKRSGGYVGDIFYDIK